jgi:hypothetical protein
LAGFLVATLVLTACSGDGHGGREPTAAPIPPTSASETLEAAVATTTIVPSSPADRASTSGPVDGDQLCALLVEADLSVLGQGFTPHAEAARCRWTDVDGHRSLEIGSTMLEAPPIVAVQSYERERRLEAFDALDGLGTAALLLTTSTIRTTLVVFTGDVRLDFDVPGDRHTAVDLAHTAVQRLGPRTPVPAEQ